MPAYQHGRRGQTGRPKNPAAALHELAAEAPDRRMKQLVSEAARRGLSMAMLASAFGGAHYDPRGLTRSILAKKPQDETIKGVARALGIRPLVARALVGSFSRDDIIAASQTFRSLALARASPDDLTYQSFVESVEIALTTASPKVRDHALEECVIADAGLDSRPAIEAAAVALGVEPPKISAMARRYRERQACAAWLWLAAVLRLELRSRIEIEAALTLCFDELPLLREIVLERQLDASQAIEVRETIEPALSKAVSTFSAALSIESTMKLDGVRK
jgi:hypothetical protein